MGIYRQRADCGWGIVDGKLLREDMKGRGNSYYPDVTGLLLKEGHSDPD